MIHGSRNAAANVEEYAAHYRGRGFDLLATTLDYVCGTDAKWIPPVVDLMRWEPAPLHEDDARHIRVVHTPTDPENCQTIDLVDAAHAVGGYGIQIAVGIPHQQCLVLKRRAAVGFDHLRGSFSVNSIENAALGLCNLVGVKQDYRSLLRSPLPWPEIETKEDLREVMIALRSDAALVRGYQVAARAWYETEWSPDVIGAQVADVYRGTM